MILTNCYLTASEVEISMFSKVAVLIPILLLLLYTKIDLFLYKNIWWVMIYVCVLQIVTDKRNLGEHILFFAPIALYLPYYKFILVKQKSLLFYILIIYLLECSICIWEYQSHTNLFYQISDEYQRFRSTGIWGHPLNNAMLVSVFMLFVLLSKISTKLKFILFALGFYTLFSFNARASIVMTLFSSFICFIINRKRTIYYLRKHLYIIPVIIILSIIFFSYLNNSDLGGKLFDSESRNLQDNSAQARLGALMILNNLTFEEWLFGFKAYEVLLKNTEFGFIESGTLIMLFKYGLVAAIPVLFILFKTLFVFMRDIEVKNRWILIIHIFVIGSTSPSFVNLFIWVFIYLFYTALFLSTQYISKKSRFYKLCFQ